MPRVLSFGLVGALLTISALACKSKDASPDEATPARPTVIAPPPSGELPAPADVAAPPEDAVRTASGVACVVLREGFGEEHPSMYDTVSMHQVVWTTDGTMHMNTGNRGAAVSFDVTKSVFPGLREAIEQMVEGEKRRCWIPGELAFGPAVEGAPSDGKPRGTLVYELDLVGLKKVVGLPEAPEDLAAPPEDAERSSSGLAWRVLSPGTQDKKPTPASTVSLNYTAWTPDGGVFTSTAKKGYPRSSTPAGLIAGLREGVLMMKLGEKRRFWIPPELAYLGQPGRPQGVLVYDVELVAIAP